MQTRWQHGANTVDTRSPAWQDRVWSESAAAIGRKELLRGLVALRTSDGLFGREWAEMGWEGLGNAGGFTLDFCGEQWTLNEP